jgi:hypothetical protein
MKINIKIVIFLVLFVITTILFLSGINTRYNNKEKYVDAMNEFGLIDINSEEEDDNEQHFMDDPNPFNKSIKYTSSRYNNSNKTKKNHRGSKY